jgi:DNA-binding XRE family transcriptional regulator
MPYNRGDDLERIARRAPKAWRSQKALRQDGFVRIQGGLDQAAAASRLRRLTRQMQALRKKAGLTRSQVARRMGTSASTVSIMEENDPAQLTLAKLEAYARAVGADLCLSLQPGQ